MEREKKLITIAVLGSGIAKRNRYEPGYDARLRVAAAAGLAKEKLRAGQKVRLILLGGESMTAEGIHLSEAKVMEENVLKRYRFAPDAMTVVRGERSFNTIDNLIELAQLIGPSEVVIITNTYHQRRAQLILAMLFPRIAYRGRVLSAESILIESDERYLPVVEAFTNSEAAKTMTRREHHLLVPSLMYAFLQNFKRN